MHNSLLNWRPEHEFRERKENLHYNAEVASFEFPLEFLIWKIRFNSCLAEKFTVWTILAHLQQVWNMFRQESVYKVGSKHLVYSDIRIWTPAVTISIIFNSLEDNNNWISSTWKTSLHKWCFGHAFFKRAISI